MAQDDQAAPSSAPVKVPADLLDADMLYQRDAVLHAGRAGEVRLGPGRRRVLHALICARDGEVIADPGADGTDVLADAAASLLVDRAVADVDPPRIVVVEGGEATFDFPQASDPTGTADVTRPWLDGRVGDLPAAEGAFLQTAASYLDRDVSQLDLRGARMGLRGRLDRINSARMILVNVVAAGADQDAVGLQVERLADLCRFGEALEERLLAGSRSLKRIDAALDPIRAYELWLAVHVYECVWLDLAGRGEAPADRQLVERVPAGELAGVPAGDGPIDLLGVLGAHAVGAEAVRPLVDRATRTYAAGDAGLAAPGSALLVATDACRWDFSAGA